MKYIRAHVRGISILGVFICVLMLTGVSCGGTNAMTSVSKGVSTTYYVSGFVWCDHDDLYGKLFDDDDHPMQNWPVLYQIEGDENIYSVYTNMLGNYTISRGEDVYVDVWLVPGTYQPHWQTYYVYDGAIEFGDPDPVVRVPENENCALHFAGSDYGN
jgi:hypothetical protein